MALKKHLQTRGSNTVKYNYVPKLPTEWILLRQGKNVLIYAHVYENKSLWIVGSHKGY